MAWNCIIICTSFVLGAKWNLTLRKKKLTQHWCNVRWGSSRNWPTGVCIHIVQKNRDRCVWMLTNKGAHTVLIRSLPGWCNWRGRHPSALFVTKKCRNGVSYATRVKVFSGGEQSTYLTPTFTDISWEIDFAARRYRPENGRSVGPKQNERTK